MNALRNWRAYLPNKERLYLLLAVSGIAALALGIFAFVALSLVPNVRTRTELIAVVATAEQNVIVAETVQAAAPAHARAEVATAQAAVNEAARGFLSEAQAAAALNHLYQYARESGVTIVELQAQAAPQGAGANVYRLITFGLRVTGALPRLVNFLARIREATLSGFVINNVSITEDKAGDGTNAVASMNVDIYTSPYADTAATQPITGMPTLPLLPTLTPAIPLPGVTLLPGASLEPAPTLPFTVTMIPTLAPAGTHTPIVTGQPTPLTPVIIATTAVAPATIAPTAIVPTPLPTTPVACAVLVANGDFEVDGAWIIGQSVKPPQFTSSQKHAGARAMQLGSPPESGALNRGSYSSIRQLITIPASASIATLRWWHLYGSAEAVATDPGGTSDRQEVLLLRPDEKVLAVLQRVRRNDGVWQQETLDLSAYRGQSVYLYFNVFNDGNGAPTWMYVDDVQLDTCVATPVPTAGTPVATVATNTPIVTAAPTTTPTTPVTAAVTPTPSPTFSPTALTPAPTVPSGCTNLLINGDFENESGWLIGQAALLPQYTTSQKQGGARAMQLGNPPGAGLTDRSSYSSIRQLVNLPADATTVTLRWWHLYGSAEAVAGDPGTASDRQELLLLTPDEKVLAILQRVRRNDGSWQQETVDLTPYRGRSVYLYFNVYNNGNGAATWAYIDDVQFEACSGVTPAPTNTPIVIATNTNPAPTLAVTPTGAPTLTPLPTAPVVCMDHVINGSFEDDGSWTSVSERPPQITDSQKYSGARSMEFGNSAGDSSIQQLVTIPADASIVTLHWWHFYGTGETVAADPGDTGDRQEVLLRDLNGVPVRALQRTRRNDSGWLQETVDLTADLAAYRGQSFYLYFNVFNDGAGGSTWMYLDAVQLEVCSPSLASVPTPTAIMSCTSDTYNCSNFATQTDAQQMFDYCFNLVHIDIHRLDQNNNGIACEEPEGG